MATLLLTDLERPGRGLKDILSGLAWQIVGAVQGIAENPAVRVHDIRVAAKKVRSLLRLTVSEIPDDHRIELIANLRAIKNAFSGSRDEEAMRQRLGQVFSPEEAEDIAPRLGLSGGEQVLYVGPAAVSGSKLSAHLATVDLQSLQPAQLIEAASQSYGRARKTMQKCLASPRNETMHEWRKRVKDVGYQVAALSTLPKVGKLSPSLDKLAESLGEYHDFAMLGERASHLKKVAAKISAAKRKVGRRCFKDGKKLFHPSSRKFARTLERAMRELP